MQNILFSPYSPHASSTEITDKLIKCYQDVFAGSPWFESWPYEQVRADLYHEINPDASGWIASDEDQVVGFCWGYPITMHELEKKIKISCGIDLGQTVAYQDEVGVLPEYRGQKIAKAMVLYRLRDFMSRGLTYGVVRTKESPVPSQTFHWYIRLGYNILARYPNGRVVMGRSLQGLEELLK
jgi:ribosomal protein S18 acetylase RimI-like enzyme